jgi:hypothetical protein
MTANTDETNVEQHLTQKTTTSPAPNYQNNIKLACGFLRDIRAEVRNIQSLINEIKEKLELVDPKARKIEVCNFIPTVEKMFNNNSQAIIKYIESLRALFKNNPDIYDLCGDDLTNIENSWDRIVIEWPHVSENCDIDIEKLLPKYLIVEKKISEILFLISCLTIPERTNDNLSQMRIGHILNFHEVFQDEVPLFEDRKAILRKMDLFSAVVGGVIDVDSGLIYRIDPKPWRRVLSFIYILSFFCLCSIIFYIISFIIPSLITGENLMYPKPISYVISFILVLTGGIVHSLVDLLKQYRYNKSSNYKAIDDFWLWVHTREMKIIIQIIYSFFASLFYSLSQINTELEMSNGFYINALFIGYFIDSFFDIFLQRFNMTTQKQFSSLKEEFEKK